MAEQSERQAQREAFIAERVAPVTVQSLIRTYSQGVASGLFDQDLNSRERRLVSVMLNLASNGPFASVYYAGLGDGDSDTRKGLCQHLGDIIWQARPLVLACSPASSEAFEAAHARTVEILRGI